MVGNGQPILITSLSEPSLISVFYRLERHGSRLIPLTFKINHVIDRYINQYRLGCISGELYALIYLRKLLCRQWIVATAWRGPRGIFPFSTLLVVFIYEIELNCSGSINVNKSRRQAL
jgi:hypothetical protein